ncbi:MAG: lysophospholipid acyltransferase family protein [Armatimonadota bacterium]|nr:lysophospholipid acyltransferase family protein [Armatimonadota bacterium]
MADENALPLKKRIERKAGGWALISLARIFQVLPKGRIDPIGRWLGRRIMGLSRKYRERTVKNLRLAYPEWTDKQIRETAKAVFEHFGKTMARFFGGGKEASEEILASIDFRGMEHVDEALRQGKGILAVTAHFGNWERMAESIAIQGYKISVVARDANEARTTRIVNDVRKGRGIDVFSRGRAARELLRRLRANEIVGMLTDQNTREILVPFFGIPAGTNEGPAVIHLLTGTPIFTVFATEQPDGRYDVNVEPLEIPVLTGDRKADVVAIMTQVNRKIEEAVRGHPEQWLWMHDRWRWARELGLVSDG